MSLVPWDLDCRDCGYPLWYGQVCPQCGWSEDEGWEDQQDVDDDDDYDEEVLS